MLNKRPRLKRFDYKGHYSYFITICTHNKIPLFKDAVLVNQSIKMLRKKSDIFGFKVWAFCYMPDHLHLLIEGKSQDSDLKQFISSYKQSTGYYYSNHRAVAVAQDVAQSFSPANSNVSHPVAQDFSPAKNNVPQNVAQDFTPAQTDIAQVRSPGRSAGLQPCQALWQPSYYDHILRKDEAITDIARYIFDNPVRKGLVKHYTDYEHTGSFELDLKNFF